jgi:DNA-binding NarL/FixJ family response regulator
MRQVAKIAPKPNVLLVDDYTLIREAITAVLAPWFKVLGVGSGIELVEAMRDLQPEVVLMEVSMPKVNGFDIARQLLVWWPNTKIIFLTTQDAPYYMERAFSLGAKGYVLKHFATSELTKAIQTVISGQPYRPPFFEAAGKQPEDQPRLSSRQLTVLRLISEGKNNKQIGDELGISPRTAEFHKKAIMGKLALRTSAELTRYALANGLV